MPRFTTLAELPRVRNPEDLTTLEEAEAHGDAFQQLMQTLFQCADGSLLLDTVVQRPWLKEFYGSNDFADSLSAFPEDVNGSTIALIEHFELIAHTILFAAWQTNIGEHLESLKQSAAVEKPVDGIDTKMASAFLAALPELENSRNWHDICQGLRKFALLVGRPKAYSNPFETINALRDFTLRASSASREANLLVEIAQLRKQIKVNETRNRSQSRIIANLGYRHLLEHLPGPPPKNASNTAHWQAFWSQAVQNTDRSTTHPLTALLQRFGNDKRMLAQIQKVGEGMYGTLSTTIHHFQGVYNIEPSQ